LDMFIAIGVVCKVVSARTAIDDPDAEKKLDGFMIERMNAMPWWILKFWDAATHTVSALVGVVALRHWPWGTASMEGVSYLDTVAVIRVERLIVSFVKMMLLVSRETVAKEHGDTVQRQRGGPMKK